MLKTRVGREGAAFSIDAMAPGDRTPDVGPTDGVAAQDPDAASAPGSDGATWIARR